MILGATSTSIYPLLKEWSPSQVTKLWTTNLATTTQWPPG